MKKPSTKYPASMIVHWPTGLIACCTKHGNALLGLANMLGSHVVATKLMDKAECSNCVNEVSAKK